VSGGRGKVKTEEHPRTSLLIATFIQTGAVG
jgi:hypothetical protein